MKSFLSGMPELKLGLNDKALFEATGRSSSKGKAVEMEDIKFHQCVRLARFESDRTISFIPPDGEFDLMTYRLATHVKPLIWVEAVVEPHSRSRIEYMVKAKSQFKSRSIANNVEIVIPVPPDVDSPSFKCSIGSVTSMALASTSCVHTLDFQVSTITRLQMTGRRQSKFAFVSSSSSATIVSSSSLSSRSLPSNVRT
uniref:MHD domain-containing protein n=1 Tax=Hyaloperonospora arabidopsidis (strain Emoy2) TaxID=559515 RepID=M4B9Q9_HYAAE